MNDTSDYCELRGFKTRQLFKPGSITARPPGEKPQGY